MSFNTIDEIINALEQNNFYGLYAIEDRDPTTSDACTRENGIWLNKKTGEFFIFVEYDSVKGYIWKSLNTGLPISKPNVSLYYYHALLEIPVSISFPSDNNKTIIKIEINENKIEIINPQSESLILDNIDLSLFWNALIDSLIMSDIHFTDENDEPIYFSILTYSRIHKKIVSLLLLNKPINTIKVYAYANTLSSYLVYPANCYKYYNYFNIINEDNESKNYTINELILNKYFSLSILFRSYSGNLYDKNYQISFLDNRNNKLIEFFSNPSEDENYLKIKINPSITLTFPNNINDISKYKFVNIDFFENLATGLTYMIDKNDTIFNFPIDFSYFASDKVNLTLDSKMFSQIKVVNFSPDTTASALSSVLHISYDTTSIDTTATIRTENIQYTPIETIIPDEIQTDCTCELYYVNNYYPKDIKNNYILDFISSNSDIKYYNFDNKFYMKKYHDINLIYEKNNNSIEFPITIIIMIKAPTGSVNYFLSNQKKLEYLTEEEINFKVRYYSSYDSHYYGYTSHYYCYLKNNSIDKPIDWNIVHNINNMPNFFAISLYKSNDTTLNISLATLSISSENNNKGGTSVSCSSSLNRLASSIFSLYGEIEVDNDNNILSSSYTNNILIGGFFLIKKAFSSNDLLNLLRQMKSNYLNKHYKLKEILDKF